MEKITILGAGLCGTLLAIRLAQRGYQVDVYERRSDLRKKHLDAGRSINLALSDRGLKALRLVNLEDKVRDMVIPMYGRMIHPLGGEPKLYRYSGRAQDFINSVSRPGLNALLLNEADQHENVNIHFDTKASDIDFKRKTIVLKNMVTSEKRTVNYQYLLGADGAGSSLRKAMSRKSNQIRFNFSQSFLDTGYKELRIAPGENGAFKIEKNALHIWPREGFMMIALPNLDGSFTVTLFIPFEGKNSMEQLQNKEDIRPFFQHHFPDVVDNLDNLEFEFFDNPTSSLGTIKCFPWQVNQSSMLIGDACHAIVPFYGQGMNAAFEDVFEFDRILDQVNGDWNTVFEQYEDHRKMDTDAIADLAADNFYEMRDATADPVFNFKRTIELQMEQEIDNYYSKYGLVTFQENIPYHQAMIQGRKQDNFLMKKAKEFQESNDDIDLKDLFTEMKSFL